jgi:hypothetical protein
VTMRDGDYDDIRSMAEASQASGLIGLGTVPGPPPPDRTNSPGWGLSSAPLEPTTDT